MEGVAARRVQAHGGREQVVFGGNGAVGPAAAAHVHVLSAILPRLLHDQTVPHHRRLVEVRLDELDRRSRVEQLLVDADGLDPVCARALRPVGHLGRADFNIGHNF